MILQRATLLLWVLWFTEFAPSLRAQRGALSSEDARPRLAQVRALKHQQQGEEATTQNPQSTTELKSAATLVGFRNDTAYLVTANHTVRNALWIYAGISPIRDWLPASVVAADPRLDYAVLAVWINPQHHWIAPRVPRRERDVPAHGEKIYALGCPQDRCDYPAIPGEWDSSDGGEVQMKGLLLEPGLSGGPITDEDGALIAIATKVALPDGFGVDWSYLRSFLGQVGVPTELPPVAGVRRRSIHLKAYTTPWPRPGRDSDGALMMEGIRFELSAYLGSFNEVAIGYDRVVYNARSYWYNRPDTYVTRYVTLGYRATARNPFFSISPRGHDYGSIGLDFLVPLAKSSVITYVHTDSINIRFGEEALIRGATLRRTGVGWALRLDYRIPLSERFGLMLGGTAYKEAIDDEALSSYDSKNQLQIGGDFRWKF